MNKMTLIYVKGSANVAPGNVLAGLSRTAVSAETPPPSGSTDEEKRTIELQKVSELIGVEMLVRSLREKTMVGGEKYPFSDTEFRVAFEHFGLFTTDLDPDVLKDPRRYYFDETEKKVKTLPAPAIVGGSPDVALTAANIKVTLPSPATLDTGVWVLIQAVGSSAKGQVRSDVITKDPTIAKPAIVLNGVLPSGSYSILTLVTGYQPTVFSVP